MYSFNFGCERPCGLSVHTTNFFYLSALQTFKQNPFAYHSRRSSNNYFHELNVKILLIYDEQNHSMRLLKHVFISNTVLFQSLRILKTPFDEFAENPNLMLL